MSRFGAPSEAQQEWRRAAQHRRMEALAAIKAGLTKAGHTVEGIRADGIDMDLSVKEGRRPDHTHGRYQLHLSFGDYGHKQRFPEPLAGFDITRIVTSISTYLAEVKLRNAARLNRDDQRFKLYLQAKRINDIRGLSNGHHVRDPRTGERVNSEPATPLHVDVVGMELRVVINKSVSAEEAESILGAVDEILKGTTHDEALAPRG